ncbi:MAG: flagellar biosynthesis protein FlhB, partial [Planctomycetota bacterium]|nr:flagellar biosynthesis protein FlhB [Planctomycetota bacterium]
MPGNEEKTEEATAKKRQDARLEGNVAKSRDLTAAVELIGAIVILKLFGWLMAEYSLDFTVRILSMDFPTLEIPDGKEIVAYATNWCFWLVILVLPFLLLTCVVAIGINLYQIGLLFTTKPLKLNFNKLNPVSGMKKLFSVSNLVMLALNSAKLCVIMPIAWYTIIAELQSVMVIVEMEAAGTFIYMTRAILDLALKLACILFILGYADYLYQKYKYNKGLKMTKQEVKEEFKQMEGDPKVKQKRRQIQMQQAMQRMMSEVPQAEVVVRNPTHYAVAISYKPHMVAPVVVAKGMNLVALKIIDAAREAGIPLHEDPPLARELYRTVEIGEEIPAHLYEAIAKILELVMTAEKRAAAIKATMGEDQAMSA